MRFFFYEDSKTSVVCEFLESPFSQCNESNKHHLISLIYFSHTELRKCFFDASACACILRCFLQGSDPLQEGLLHEDESSCKKQLNYFFFLWEGVREVFDSRLEQGVFRKHSFVVVDTSEEYKVTNVTNVTSVKNNRDQASRPVTGRDSGIMECLSHKTTDRKRRLGVFRDNFQQYTKSQSDTQPKRDKHNYTYDYSQIYSYYFNLIRVLTYQLLLRQIVLTRNVKISCLI